MTYDRGYPKEAPQAPNWQSTRENEYEWRRWDLNPRTS